MVRGSIHQLFNLPLDRKLEFAKVGCVGMGYEGDQVRTAALDAELAQCLPQAYRCDPVVALRNMHSETFDVKGREQCLELPRG